MCDLRYKTFCRLFTVPQCWLFIHYLLSTVHCPILFVLKPSPAHFPRTVDSGQKLKIRLQVRGGTMVPCAHIIPRLKLTGPSEVRQIIIKGIYKYVVTSSSFWAQKLENFNNKNRIYLAFWCVFKDIKHVLREFFYLKKKFFFEFVCFPPF